MASYHGDYDEGEFNRRQRSIHEWYERAALPFERCGMALRDVSAVALTAFVCLIAASLNHMATIFPDWITVGQDGALIQISWDKSLEMSTQVLPLVGYYQRRVPEGLFKEEDDFSAI